MISVNTSSTQRLVSPLQNPPIAARLALVSLLGLVGIAVASGKQSTKDQLSLDVDYLNEIVARYENARGWFSQRDDAQLVLSRLSYASGEYNLPLMHDSHGVKLVPVVAEEAPVGEKWAYWNHAINRFVVWKGTPPLGVQVILRFKRSFKGRPRAIAEAAESIAAQSLPLPIRKASEPELKPGRLRDEPVVPSAPSITPRAEQIVSAWSKGSATQRRLDPPSFNPPGGVFPLASYPLTVEPDISRLPEGATLMVSVSNGEWQAFEKPIAIQAGDRLLSYVDADALLHHTDSEPVLANYTIEPIQLQLGLKAPVKEMPAAAFAPGSERPELFPTVTLGNLDHLPVNARDRDSFEVLWTIDGSDPMSSNTAFPVLFEGGSSARDQRLPMGLATFLGTADQLQIRAVARAKNTSVLAHSDEVSVLVKVIR